MTDPRPLLERIEQALEGITPGLPWESYFTVHGDPYVATKDRGKFGMVVSASPDDYGKANCEFIAAAPDLLREAKETLATQASEIERLREAINEVYPAVAGRCSMLLEAGEENAHKNWLGYSRTLYAALGETQPERTEG